METIITNSSYFTPKEKVIATTVANTGGYLAVDARIVGLNVLNLLKTVGVTIVSLTIAAPIAIITTSSWACYNGFCDSVTDWKNFLADPTFKKFFTAMFKTCYTALQAFFIISGVCLLLGIFGIGFSILSAALTFAIPIAGLGLSFFVSCRAIVGLKEALETGNREEIKRSLLFLLIGIAGLIGFFAMIFAGPLSIPCLTALIVFGLAWTAMHSWLLSDRLASGLLKLE